jgi:hypothetical protein
MTDQVDCSSSPVPTFRPVAPRTPAELHARSSAQAKVAAERQRREDAAYRYTVEQARLVLWEMAAYLRHARDRIEDTAYRLPDSEGREAMLCFERPYDVPTEMWQVSTEVAVALEELIDRLEAASRVKRPQLVLEFPELQAAAG